MKYSPYKSNPNPLEKLAADGTIKVPHFWLPNNLMYLTLMGSRAYGINNPDSDYDYYGFCMPPHQYVWPAKSGYISGYDVIPVFDQWQSHSIKDKEGKELDFQVFSIAKFFKLAQDCNPNILDSLFTPDDAVVWMDFCGSKVRKNRHLFLSKILIAKFKGYAKSQLKKLMEKNPIETGKRYSLVQQYGYDTKFAYHLIRLGLECADFLEFADVDWAKYKDVLINIRTGKWDEKEVMEYWYDLEDRILSLEEKTELPEEPDYNKIKRLLNELLEDSRGGFNRYACSGQRLHILEKEGPEGIHKFIYH